MATYLTAIGAMLVPLGVLLAVEVPNWKWLAFALIVTGLVAVIVGLIYTIREVRQKRKEDELRIRREMASLTVLTFIADAFDIELKHLDEK